MTVRAFLLPRDTFKHTSVTRVKASTGWIRLQAANPIWAWRQGKSSAVSQCFYLKLDHVFPAVAGQKRWFPPSPMGQIHRTFWVYGIGVLDWYFTLSHLFSPDIRLAGNRSIPANACLLRTDASSSRTFYSGSAAGFIHKISLQNFGMAAMLMRRGVQHKWQTECSSMRLTKKRRASLLSVATV
jgi:hypothetical protein